MAYRFAADRFIERDRAATSPRAGGAAPLIAFIFPGQGSQKVGMGKALADAFPICRETFAEADAALGEPLSRICFEGPEDQLTLTENTQPAILAVSIAAYRLLASRGLSPAFVAGHSLGEYSAQRRGRHVLVRRRAARSCAAAAATCRRPCRSARARWRRFSASMPSAVAAGVRGGGRGRGRQPGEPERRRPGGDRRRARRGGARGRAREGARRQARRFRCRSARRSTAR